VEGHPGGLQGRRAVPVDGGAGQVIVSEQYRDHASHVESLLAAGQPAAEDQIAHVSGIELRHFRQRRRHDLRGQVVRADARKRAFARPANGRPRGGDDHCFGHGPASSHRVHPDYVR
jgi:hypothetical protein